MVLFAATFFAVFLLSFQQQNVVHGHYFYAAITSVLIAGAQFALFKGVMASDLTGVAYMGVGGACGVTLSMLTHKRMVRRNTNDEL